MSVSQLSQKPEDKYVKKAFLLKFGNLYVTPKEKKTYSAKIEKLKQMFNSSPLVKEVKTIEALYTCVMLRISLPTKNQETSKIDTEIFGKDADLTSEFGVAYDGSIYLIFREVDISKFLFAGGMPDIRRVLIEMVSKEKAFETKHFPPNPMRQYIYLVYLADDPSVRKFIGRIYREYPKIYLYLSENQSKAFEQTIARFLLTTSMSLNTYYHAISLSKELAKTAADTSTIHQSIQSIIEESLETSFWNVHKHYTYSKDLEKLVSRHYSTLLEYSSDWTTLEEEVGIVEKRLNNDFLLSHFKNELLDDIKLKKIDIDTMTKCVSFAREFVQRSYTTKATLLGALIGIIGTIVGTIFLHFLGF